MPKIRKSHPPGLKDKAAVKAIKAHKTATQIAQVFGFLRPRPEPGRNKPWLVYPTSSATAESRCASSRIWTKTSSTNKSASSKSTAGSGRCKGRGPGNNWRLIA
jgi:hypothetical protein